MWDSLDTWKQRAVILLFFAGLVWAVFGRLDTPLHMDVEAAELWAASDRKDACRDAIILDEQILAHEIRLATEELTPEARQLIDNLLEKLKARRKDIREKHGC